MKKSIVKDVWSWIDERISFEAMIHSALDENIPGGSSYAYTFGSMALTAFSIQVITGIFQLFYYVPAVDHAYDSVQYLRTQVPFGWLVHNLHYWGNQAMIILVGLHMIRVFVWGSFKKPREMTWMIGVILLLLTAAMTFTGALLPWDELGYWAAQVGTSMMGTVPVIGGSLEAVARGGQTMGQLTLSRFFVVHAVIIPVILLGFIALHLVSFRKQGSAGPWRDTADEPPGKFWPEQIFKDTNASLFLLLLLIGLSVFAPPSYTGPADPVDTTYLPRPEWNFFFLYRALRFFPGPLEPLGTIGIPAVLVLLLLLVPFLDRRKERHPLQRPFPMLSGFLLVSAITALTIIGYYGLAGKGTAGVSRERPATALSRLSPSAREGQKLIQTLGCTGCHSIDNIGGKVGPALTYDVLKKRSRRWLITQIRDPKAHHPGTIMPSFDSLTREEVDHIVDYMMTIASAGPQEGIAARETVPETSQESLKNAMAGFRPAPEAMTNSSGKTASPPDLFPMGPPGEASTIIGNAEHGAKLYGQQCRSCHGLQGTGRTPNPGSQSGVVPALKPVSRELYSTDPQVFVDNIDRFIQHGSMPEGKKPAVHMPAFGDTKTLTQQQIAEIEAYILELNGVDRAEIEHPGIQPDLFFSITLIVFFMAALVLWAVWGLGGRRPS